MQFVHASVLPVPKFPSQNVFENGALACSAVTLTMVHYMSGIATDGDLMNLKLEGIVKSGVILYSMWKESKLVRDTTTPAVTSLLATSRDILDMVSSMRTMLENKYAISETAGWVRLFDARNDKLEDRANGAMLQSLENLCSELDEGEGFTVTVAIYTFLVWRTPRRWFLFDSHGLDDVEDGRRNSIFVLVDSYQTVCAELRRLWGRVAVPDHLGKLTFDYYSALVFRRKKPEIKNQ